MCVCGGGGNVLQQSSSTIGVGGGSILFCVGIKYDHQRTESPYKITWPAYSTLTKLNVHAKRTGGYVDYQDGNARLLQACVAVDLLRQQAI